MSIINVGDVPINENLVDGTELARRLERLYAAFHSQNSNPTRPPSITAGGIWSKTVTGGIEVMLFDGTYDTKIGSVVDGQYRLSNDVFISAIGGLEAALHLKNDTSDVYFFNSNSGNSVGLWDATAAKPLFSYERALNKWTIFTNGVARVIIDEAGDTGFGVADPVGKVDAISNGYSAYVARSASSGANVDVIGLKAIDSGAVNFANVAYQARSHVWGYNGATLGMELTNSGVLSLANGQLKFPVSQVASADPNTLDDYEEGNWTPTDVSGAGLGFTYYNQSKYIKIGKFVYAFYDFAFPSTSNTAPANIGGLPFVVGAGGALSNGYSTSAKTIVTDLTVGNSNYPLLNTGFSTQITNNQLSTTRISGVVIYLSNN